MRAVLLLTTLLIFNCFDKTAFCQYRDLSFNHLSVNNGLSQGVNNCIFKDSKGYTWISSFDGLNRFDGIDCIIYRDISGDSSSVKGTLFLNILEDRNNDLWIGSNEGLNFYNRKLNSFTCYYIPDNRSVNQTFSPFYIDNENNVWLQSGKDILYLETRTGKFKTLYHFNNPGNLIVLASPVAQLQPLQKITVAQRGGSHIYSAAANRQQLNFISANLPAAAQLSINTFCIDHDNLWIGTNTGLFYYTANQLINIPLSAPNNKTPKVLSLQTDSKNILWAGTEKDGLFYITKENKIAQRQYANSIYNPYSISGNQVQYIYTDNENNLWVAIWGKGISYVNLEKFRFQHYLTKQEASRLDLDNFIRSIVEIKPNRFWCGTQSNGILMLDENKNIIGKISDDLPPSIEHIYKDEEGTVWIATVSGLFTADRETGKVKQVDGFGGLALPSRQFNYVYGLQDGRCLASTNNGIFFISNSDNQASVDPVKGIPDNDVYLTSFQAGNGDIYLCRAFKGFAVYRQQHDSMILKKDFFDQSTVKCFAEADDSTLWIGTTKGLIRFNKSKTAIIKTYTTTDGLANQYIYGALLQDNNLWLSTNAGLSKFNIPDNNFKNFTIEDGLQSNEFNTYSFCRTSNGELIFGGVNGINAFFPSQLKRNLKVPEILLQKVLINDTAAIALHNPGELNRLNLKYTENTISFQFVVIDYSNPNGCRFLYRLEGYDKDWITSANKSIIRYANLPPGSYTLHAKAVSAEGIISTKVYSLLISVQTPWHQAWWFRTLLLLLFAVLTWYLVKNFYARKLARQKAELEKQRAVEKERTRIATDMHDDFGASLSRIKFLSEKMQVQQTDKDKLNSDLEKISAYSDEMSEKMGEIVWALNERYDSSGDLVSFCRSYATEYLDDKNIQLHFSNEQTSDIFIHGEIRRNIFLVIKEALHNAVKHSEASVLSISMNAGDRLEVIIKDNGKGMDLDHIRPFANGLENMKKRIGEVGGSIRFDTQAGTQIIISVPC